MSSGLLQMPMKAIIRNGEINLSFRDLKEVPIREIAAVKAVTILNLSNNQLITLGDNFCQLTYIQKLDLSKNRLTSLPVNFGNLILLKHLDLSSNQLKGLPLSFGKLKNLKWLSLKNNPLVSDLAAIVGPCQTSQQCQDCAKYVVKFLLEAQLELEKKRQEIMDNNVTSMKGGGGGGGVEMKEVQRKKEKKAKAKKKNKLNEKKNCNNKYLTNLVKKTSQKINFYSNINDNNYYNNSNVKSSRKKSESGGRSFIWTLITGTTFIFLALGFIYLVDFEKFIKIKDGAYFYANKCLNILPPEVVKKGKETVEYIRPFAEVTASKINVFLNETSTFMNTNPLVKDHWTNIREIISICSACMLDYIRTLYWHSTTYCNYVKNKLFQ